MTCNESQMGWPSLPSRGAEQARRLEPDSDGSQQGRGAGLVRAVFTLDDDRATGIDTRNPNNELGGVDERGGRWRRGRIAMELQAQFAIRGLVRRAQRF